MLFRKRTLASRGVVLLLVVGCIHADEKAWIVKDGEPQAQIVIADSPPRMVGIAARELQLYLAKITAAELPIVTEPTDGLPLKVFVGRSDHTDRLGITDEGLKYGAYRMVSGPDWLALVGRDFDFVPVDPWPDHHRNREQADLDWDKVTGHTWLNPMTSIFRDYNRNLDIWKHDEGGSLNAVCDFLRSLGVRWYMPGPLGEVVPAHTSIPLPEVDKTVQPSFALRKLVWSNYMSHDWDDLIWDRRMGLNSGYEVWGAKAFKSHGIRAVIGRPEMQAAHPEYYALLGGSRDTTKNGFGTPCLRSEGLIRETIAFVRASYDHYNEPMVCIWPVDGFRQCQCELCRDIEISDYVWGFVDRVAREVYKTHPDRRISCGAYSSYALPPAGIDRFSPNVVVYIANRGRPAFSDPEAWQRYWETIEGWRAKVAPGNIVRGENNLYAFAHGGRSGPVTFPALHPRAFARDLQALRGIAMGERNETARGVRQGDKNNTWAKPGVDHLNLYVNARFLWDADQDIEALLDEYYTLFYGPARDEMQAAFEYADANFPAAFDAAKGGWLPPMEVRAQFVELMHKARAAAGDTVYGERIRLILDELPSLDALRIAGELSLQRGEEVMIFDRLLDMGNDKYFEDRETFQADGRFDERFWQCYPVGRNLLAADGKRPALRTSFMARWYNNSIYFGVTCEEDTDIPLNIPTTRDGDPAILEGDRVEFLIETGPESYYRIVVNPAGALLDMDMTAERDGAAWSSNADVGVHVGDGFWSVEIRLPVVSEGEASMDHLNAMAGRLPTRAWPWYFNVGRVRVRPDGTQVMAYSPLNGSDLTDRIKFALMAHMGDTRRMLQAREDR